MPSEAPNPAAIVKGEDAPIERPTDQQQVIRRPRCPNCDTGNVGCYAYKGPIRYYVCRDCKDEATGKRRTFKVIVV